MSDTAAWSPVAGPPGLVADDGIGCTGERASSAVRPREARTGAEGCGSATVARGRRSHAPTTVAVLVAAFGTIAADPNRADCVAWTGNDDDGGKEDKGNVDGNEKDDGGTDSGRVGTGV